MTAKIDYRNTVADALEKLSEEEGDIGIFRVWFTARDVARKAGVAEATARRHLDDLSHCRGFMRRKIKGSIGYHFSMLGHR